MDGDFISAVRAAEQDVHLFWAFMLTSVSINGDWQWFVTLVCNLQQFRSRYAPSSADHATGAAVWGVVGLQWFGLSLPADMITAVGVGSSEQGCLLEMSMLTALKGYVRNGKTWVVKSALF